MPGKLLIRKEIVYYPGFQINKIFYHDIYQQNKQ